MGIPVLNIISKAESATIAGVPMRKAFLLFLVGSMLAQPSRFQPVFSSGPKPIGPYSPGLWTGERLYVSGQGARTADGRLPEGAEAQIRQTLDNVKAIVEAGGLTMDHVAFSHTYVADMAHYGALNKVWKEFFPRHQPARATVGVAAMPGGTPFEINAVAFRDKAQFKALSLPGAATPVPLAPGLQTKDRVYVSGILGRDAAAGVVPAAPGEQVEMAFARLKSILAPAGLSLAHMLQLTVYTTAAMPDEAVAAAIQKHIPNAANVAISVTRVVSLPFGANVEMTGVATRTLAARARHGNCVSAGSTIYCGQFTADDYRTSLIGLNGLLQKFTPNPVIAASGVFLDDLKEFAAMNKVYAEVMGPILPVRTTLQPDATGRSARFRISVVAER